MINSIPPHRHIHPFRAGGAEDQRRVARAVDEACREIGFLVASSGTGVPQDLIDRSHAASASSSI